jgi:hypothetical protein
MPRAWKKLVPLRPRGPVCCLQRSGPRWVRDLGDLGYTSWPVDIANETFWNRCRGTSTWTRASSSTMWPSADRRPPCPRSPVNGCSRPASRLSVLTESGARVKVEGTGPSAPGCPSWGNGLTGESLRPFSRLNPGAGLACQPASEHIRACHDGDMPDETIEPAWHQALILSKPRPTQCRAR